MPISKNFFEGYSRSKDMLTTIAEKLVSATMENPWSIKSSGYITSTIAQFNGKQHVCMRKDFNGNIINVLFVENWNTSTNNIYNIRDIFRFIS